MAQQQHNYGGVSVPEMRKDFDNYYDVWTSCVEFEEGIKDQLKKDYFRRIFPEFAHRFIDKKIKPDSKLISNCELADLFIEYVNELPAEQQRVKIDDINRSTDPKKHLACRIAKFLDSPEEFYIGLEQQRRQRVVHHN